MHDILFSKVLFWGLKLNTCKATETPIISHNVPTPDSVPQTTAVARTTKGHVSSHTHIKSRTAIH